MLQALSQNSSLKAFSLVWDGYMEDDEVEAALVQMVQQNDTIQTINLRHDLAVVSVDAPDATHGALEQAFARNTTLLNWSGNFAAIALPTLGRNRELVNMRQWRILAALAHCGPQSGFHSLHSDTFRGRVFAYFLTTQRPNIPRSFRISSFPAVEVAQPGAHLARASQTDGIALHHVPDRCP